MRKRTLGGRDERRVTVVHKMHALAFASLRRWVVDIYLRMSDSYMAHWGAGRALRISPVTMGAAV